MLSSLIWLPFLGAAIVGFLPNLSANRARLLALSIASGVIVWTLFLLTQFNISNAGLQFSEFIPWIETLGLNYSLGLMVCLYRYWR
jgi:NAD(P)H-quinone oxidoreductase subunit 4